MSIHKESVDEPIEESTETRLSSLMNIGLMDNGKGLRTIQTILTSSAFQQKLGRYNSFQYGYLTLETHFTMVDLKRLLVLSTQKTAKEILKGIDDIPVISEATLGSWLIDDCYTVDIQDFIQETIQLIEFIVMPFYNSTHHTTKRLERLLVNDLVAVIRAIEKIDQ